jgi:3-oxoadipate CoA-transferase, beta subunit
VLREKLPSISMEHLQAITGAPLQTEGRIEDLVVPKL